MKKFLIWALIIVGVTIGIVGVGVQFAASRLVDSGLETAMLQLPENVALDYADSDVSLLSRKASLKQVDLTLADENLNVKVGELTVDELQPTDSGDVPLIMNGVQLKDVEITPLDTGETVHINEIVLRDVGDVAVQQIASRGGEEFSIPPSLDVDLLGIQVTADMLSNRETFGYELPMEADLSLKYNFSESDQDFQLNRLQFGMRDAFAFNVSTHIGGIDMDTINALQYEQSNPLAFLIVLAEKSRLYDLNLTYTDDSFADRAFAQMAKENGMTIDALKDDMLATIDEASETTTSPSSVEVNEALRDFINDPGELTVGINPETPLTFEDFFSVMVASSFGGEVDADALIERMNMTISSR